MCELRLRGHARCVPQAHSLQLAPPGRAPPGPHGANGHLPAGRTEDRARRRLQHPLASRHRQGLEQPERGGRVDCARRGRA